MRLLAAVDRDIARYRSEEVEGAPELALQRSNRRIEKSLTRWLGPLDARQREQISAWNRGRPPVAAAWTAYRVAWRAELADTLAIREQAGFCPRVRRLLTDGADLWTPEQAQLFSATREHWLDLFETLLPSLSPTQRAHWRERLLRLAGDLEAAAARPADGRGVRARSGAGTLRQA